MMEKPQEQLEKNPQSTFAEVEEHYCPICGREAADPALKRFGEFFCSEEHVAEYAQEIRERAIQAALATTEGQAMQPDGAEPTATKKGGLSRLLKLGACCAAPILALAILVPLLSGASGLFAIGGNLLVLAAFLACPLSMYFLMRSMQRMSQGERGEGHEQVGDTQATPQTRRSPEPAPQVDKGE